MVTHDELKEALALLDAKVAAAEVRITNAQAVLDDARTAFVQAKADRHGAEALVSILRPTFRATASLQVDGDVIAGSPKAAVSRGVNTGLTHVIEAVVRRRGGTVLTVDDVLAVPEVAEMASGREQVRNAIHYLARRRHVLESIGRGAWRLADSEAAPASAETASASTPTTEEGGGSYETTFAASSQNQSELLSDLGAPVTG